MLSVTYNRFMKSVIKKVIVMLCVIMLSVTYMPFMLSVTHKSFMLSGNMLNVVIPSVVVPNLVIQSQTH